MPDATYIDTDGTEKTVETTGIPNEVSNFVDTGKEIYGHEREPLVENPQNFPPSSDLESIKGSN